MRRAGLFFHGVAVAELVFDLGAQVRDDFCGNVAGGRGDERGFEDEQVHDFPDVMEAEAAHHIALARQYVDQAFDGEHLQRFANRGLGDAVFACKIRFGEDLPRPQFGADDLPADHPRIRSGWDWLVGLVVLSAGLSGEGPVSLPLGSGRTLSEGVMA